MITMNEELEFLFYSKSRLEKRVRELEKLLRLEVERLGREIEMALRLRGENEEETKQKVENQLREVLRSHPKGEKARRIAREIEELKGKIQQIEQITSSSAKGKR